MKSARGIVCLSCVALLPASAGALVQTPPGMALQSSAPQVSWSSEARTAIELLRLLRNKERPSDAELTPKLAAAGERELGLLFRILATRSVPAVDAGAKPQTLSESQESLILAALGQLDRDLVLAHVASQLANTRELPVRRAAVQLVGSVSRANDLPLLLELSLSEAETELDERMEPALRRALASTFVRDPSAFPQLIELRHVTRQELYPVLVNAVGLAGDPAGLEFLGEVAFWRDDLLLEVMAEIRVLGPSSEELVNESMKGRLRSLLDEGQPAKCNAAMLALAALRDLEAIGSLIELLGSQSRVIADTAYWSLKNLTGLTLPATQDAWSRWHQSELAWMLREKPHQFRTLRSNAPADVAAALRAITPHPLARDELRAALPDLLRNRWPAIRVLACRSLAEHHAEEAVAKLVWALEDREGEVTRAAHAALRSITGLDLPCDAAAWQAATKSPPRPTEP